MGSRALAEARLMAADLAAIGDAAGTAATIRRYVSETAGTPWLGTHATPTVTTTPVRLLLLRPATMREITESGGRLLDGDMIAHVQVPPAQLTRRDRIAVEGVEWQLASEPRPQALYGQRYLSVVLRRQGP